MLGTALFGASAMLCKLCVNQHHKEDHCSEHRLPFNDHEYENELEVAIRLAEAAGTYLKQRLHETKRITSKDVGTADFVTECDQYIEAMIFNDLKFHFPTHQFIGEESSADGEIPSLTDEPTWIIDPIDGTTNFIHSNPLTCVSIGLTVNKVPVLGVVYAPWYEEFYVAVAGQGAYLNKTRLRVSSVTSIQDAIIINEFGYVRDSAGIKRACRCLENILNCNPHSLREYGSGVLDLAFLACGRVDAVFCGVAGNGWKPWDYAAGWLLVTEAGGRMHTLDGEPFHTHALSMIGAATPELSEEMRRILSLE